MYISQNFPVPEKFEDYIYVSQLMQAYSIGIAVNTHRRSKPYCMGTLYWQLNDVWPVTSWSSVDYYGVWKALHYHSKRLYSGLYIAFNQPNMTNEGAGKNVSIHILSESLNPVNVRLSLNLRKFASTEVLSLYDETLDLEPLSNKKFYTFNMELQMTSENFNCDIYTCFLEAKVVPSSEKGLKKSQNTHFFDRPLRLKLAQAKDILVMVKDNKMREAIISLHSDIFAYGVYLYLEGYGRLNLSDNYFDLIPGETQVVTVLDIDESANLERDLRFKTLNEFYPHEA
jgi:beta-mannosidase